MESKHAFVGGLWFGRNAKLNAELDFGMTTLQLAAENGHCAVLAMLLDIPALVQIPLRAKFLPPIKRVYAH
eukprot:666848-Amphidinium_carterae.1